MISYCVVYKLVDILFVTMQLLELGVLFQNVFESAKGSQNENKKENKRQEYSFKLH